MTPLERAARALYRLHDAPPQDLLDRLKASGDDEGLAEELAEEDRVWPNYVADARAVLTAIRDFPNFNDPVTKAGSAVLSVGASPHWSKDHEAQKVWKAMIDAALSEG